LLLKEYERFPTAGSNNEAYGTMNEAIDLTDCENEPITIPGSIQPHGILLALRGSGLTVVKASANLPLFLGVAPRDTPGQQVGNGSMRRQRMH
jgi:light-regulated signal transduction histidine kinase (bacteriophytochrome)